jgi:hypothetical protein
VSQDQIIPDRPPYPGLRSFKRQESLLFFGRDRLIDGMSAALEEKRFLAVLGPSGSGKSSLVRSGLFSHLDAGLASRAGSRWTYLDIQHPRTRPYRALARVTLAQEVLHSRPIGDDEDINASDTLFDFPAEQVAERQAELFKHPMSLLRWWEDRRSHPDENLLLLVDQFEELFGYSTVKERDEVETFIDLLLNTTINPEIPIYVVITMRSEFLGGCSLFPGFAERINRGLSLTPRMKREECEMAIIGPAYGRANLDLDPLLVTTLLNDMSALSKLETADDTSAEDEGARSDPVLADVRQADLIAQRADQLPLMAHALNWLWNRACAPDPATGKSYKVRLTRDDYLAIGGLRGSLSEHAKQVLGDEHRRQAVAERVFRAVTDQPSVAMQGSAESSAVRRPRQLKEISEEAGVPMAEVAEVVNLFRADGVSMLTPDPSEWLEPETEIDIAHESIIRQWKELGAWIRDEAEAGRAWKELLRSCDAKGATGVLRGLDLTDRDYWWKRQNPHAKWAERYGGRYDEVQDLLTRSRHAARNRRAVLFLSTGAMLALAAASAASLHSTQVQSKAAQARASIADRRARQAEVTMAEVRRKAKTALQNTAYAQHTLAVALGRQNQAEKVTYAAQLAAALAQTQMKAAKEAQAVAALRLQDIQRNADRVAFFIDGAMSSGVADAFGRRSKTATSDLAVAVPVMGPLQQTSPTVMVQGPAMTQLVRGEQAFAAYDKKGIERAIVELGKIGKAGSDQKNAHLVAGISHLLAGRTLELDSRPANALSAYAMAATDLRQVGRRIPYATLAGIYARIGQLEFEALPPLPIEASSNEDVDVDRRNQNRVRSRQDLAADPATVAADACLTILETKDDFDDKEDEKLEALKIFSDQNAKPEQFEPLRIVSRDRGLSQTLIIACKSIKIGRESDQRLANDLWTNIWSNFSFSSSGDESRFDIPIWRSVAIRNFLRFRSRSRDENEIINKMFSTISSTSDYYLGEFSESRDFEAAWAIEADSAGDKTLTEVIANLELINELVEAALDHKGRVTPLQLRLVAATEAKSRVMLSAEIDPEVVKRIVGLRLRLGRNYLRLIEHHHAQENEQSSEPPARDSVDLRSARRRLREFALLNQMESEDVPEGKAVPVFGPITAALRAIVDTAKMDADPATLRELTDQAAGLIAVARSHIDQAVYTVTRPMLAEATQALCTDHGEAACSALFRELELIDADLIALLTNAPSVPLSSKELATLPQPATKDKVAIGGIDIVSCLNDMLPLSSVPEKLLDAAVDGDSMADATAEALDNAGENLEDLAEDAEGKGICRPKFGTYAFARKTGDLVWLFASEENAQSFADSFTGKQDPKYLPAIGGNDLAALFAPEPHLSQSDPATGVLIYKGRPYLYRPAGFLPDKLTDQAILWADEAYTALKANRTVKPYSGESLFRAAKPDEIRIARPKAG